MQGLAEQERQSDLPTLLLACTLKKIKELLTRRLVFSRRFEDFASKDTTLFRCQDSMSLFMNSSKATLLKSTFEENDTHIKQ